MSETQPPICSLCSVGAGKYVCPRCNAMYCGLDCYRSAAHANCSEQFYKECIQEELNVDSSADEARSMQEILARLHESQAQGEEAGMAEDEFDEEDSEADSDDLVSETEEDLAARLAGVDLDDADLVWEKLSKEEQAEFQRLVASGDTSQIVPEWEPWWNYKAALVQELENMDDFKKNCPSVRAIPALKDVSKVSPAVRFGISNVLMSYALMARHFQGDHLEPQMCQEAGITMMDLSANLGKGQNYADQETAVAAVRLQAPEILGASQDDTRLAEADLDKILSGPGPQDEKFYMLAALSNCISLLTLAQRKEARSKSKGEFSKKFPTSTEAEKNWTKKEFTLAIRKLEFYIGWIKKQLS